MKLLGLCVGALLTGASIARADVVQIAASKDVTIFNGASFVGNSASSPGLFVGTDGNGNARRGLIQFDVAGSVPAGAIITSATVTFFVGQLAGSGIGDQTARTIRLYDLTKDWNPSTNGPATATFAGQGAGAAAHNGEATWLAAKLNQSSWTTPGGDYDASREIASLSVTSQISNAANGPFPYTWGSTSNMVADVQNWLNGGPNFGWIMINDSEIGTPVPTTYRAFYTKEGAALFNLSTGAHAVAPVLTVTFTPVPEPSSLAALALGIPLLFNGGRKVRRVALPTKNGR